MDSIRLSIFGTHSSLVQRGSLDYALYRKMALVFASLWFHISSSFFFLFGFVAKLVVRMKREHGAFDSERREDLKVVEAEHEVNQVKEQNEKDDDNSYEEEASSLSFKFEYQISNCRLSSNQEPAVQSIMESKSPAITKISKYRFLSEKDVSEFLAEPEATTFRILDSYVHPESFHAEPKQQDKFDTDSFNLTNSLKELDDTVFLKKQKAFSYETNSDGAKFLSEEFSGFDSDSESSSSDGYSVRNVAVDSDDDGFLSDRDFGGYESESDSTRESKANGAAQLHSFYCSDTESNDSKDVISNVLDQKVHTGIDSVDGNDQKSEGTSMQFSHSFDAEVFRIGDRIWVSSDKSPVNHSSQSNELWSDDESSDQILELKDLNRDSQSVELSPEFEESRLPGSSDVAIEFIDSPEDTVFSLRNGEKMLEGDNPKAVLDGEDEGKNETRSNSGNSGRTVDDVVDDFLSKADDLKGLEENHQENLPKSEERHPNELNEYELDDELESLWEHQDLIEQLRMELRKVRAIGLPTILEESESPKTMEDLKPWKLDEKFLRENPIDELHKFYKSYRERMRKFDILNYQKMYAIGFLQLKDPLQSMGSQKPLIPTMTSLLLQNLWPFRHRKSGYDPSKKFVKELQSDLETVYVGQTCLSWEFLRWQYEKARGLPESDAYRSHQYNQVAGEFQQFQVIVQRFLENESFQGPRLSNYVKNRCVLRNLLQVPVIKEDCLKDRMKEQRKGNNAITSEMLEDIMEDCIRVFWEFVKADKDETPVIFKGLLRSQAELQDPSGFEIMVDAQAILQKKEKKLKDILRTGNCLVKKFKKSRADRSNQDLFFSQVDLKLVSRVLKMSRISCDQLIWCHKKLSKITFSEREVHREPAFLLFPC